MFVVGVNIMPLKTRWKDQSRWTPVWMLSNSVGKAHHNGSHHGGKRWPVHQKPHSTTSLSIWMTFETEKVEDTT